MDTALSKRIRLSIATTAALIATQGSAVMAAPVQGSLGNTSEGSVTISASVPSRVRISGLSDVSLLNQDPSAAASAAQDVCVWSNTATRGYTITASGNGSGNAFTLSDGSNSTPYSVLWSSSAGQVTGTALSAGTASSTLTSAASHQVCASGPTSSASLIVGLSTNELSAMRAGSTYTGTLTLLIAPQ